MLIVQTNDGRPFAVLSHNDDAPAFTAVRARLLPAGWVALAELPRLIRKDQTTAIAAGMPGGSMRVPGGAV